MWFDATHMKLVAAREAGHGVEPRKHVQRLVAAQKYRDVPKTQRPLEETSGVVKLKGLTGLPLTVWRLKHSRSSALNSSDQTQLRSLGLLYPLARSYAVVVNGPSALRGKYDSWQRLRCPPFWAFACMTAQRVNVGSFCGHMHVELRSVLESLTATRCTNAPLGSTCGATLDSWQNLAEFAQVTLMKPPMRRSTDS